MRVRWTVVLLRVSPNALRVIILRDFEVLTVMVRERKVSNDKLQRLLLRLSQIGRFNRPINGIKTFISHSY